jgi:cyclase
MQIYAARQVDEVILLDVSATNEGREPDFKLIEDLTSNFFSPLTVGGGIRTIEHFRKALASGADKCCISTAALEIPSLIIQAAMKFGAQAVAVSIDYRDNRLYSRSGTVAYDSSVDVLHFAKYVEDLGAGEIILNSIERDGMMSGYDLDMIGSISQAVRIPVVPCTGCGAYQHMEEAFAAGADAVAAGACYIFDDMTPRGAAQYLHYRGYQVRLDD